MKTSRIPRKMPQTWQGWVLFCLFAALLFWLNQRDAVQQPPVAYEQEQGFTARCVQVVDGDTLDVQKDGQRERIRLLGIDCMEGHNETKQSQQARHLGLSPAAVRTFSEEATAWMRSR